VLKFEGKSWRLKEADTRFAKHASAGQDFRPPRRAEVEEFDPATGRGV